MSISSKTFIPLCIPEIQGNEWTYIKECLDTGWVSSVGSYVNKFEDDLAAYVGQPCAVATVNGTAAIHTALMTCDVQPDDEVLVSTMTFIAPVNAIRYTGAHPVLVDCEPDYWQMNPEKIVEFFQTQCTYRDGTLINNQTGRKITAIIPVHILGHPVAIEAICDIAKDYNLKVIEDATESLGASYKGQKIGTFGDMACFSFNGNKLITTGGGGMIVTSDEALAHRARHLTTQAKHDALEYIHDEVGYNYRLTNLQAALGVAQLEQINSYIAKKLSIARKYNDALKNISGISPMQESPEADSVFWLYTVYINAEVYGMTARELLHKLHEEQIQTRPL
ncbi:MAG: LegC family aminotransferase, partial [Aggregatilineales bacterium]